MTRQFQPGQLWTKKEGQIQDSLWLLAALHGTGLHYCSSGDSFMQKICTMTLYWRGSPSRFQQSLESVTILLVHRAWNFTACFGTMRFLYNTGATTTIQNHRMAYVMHITLLNYILQWICSTSYSFGILYASWCSWSQVMIEQCTGWDPNFQFAGAYDVVPTDKEGLAV